MPTKRQGFVLLRTVIENNTMTLLLFQAEQSVFH